MSLPSGYKRLEYIQSSGTQYIDTGVKSPKDGLKIELDFEYTAAHDSAALFGSQNYTIPRYSICAYGASPAFWVGTSTKLLPFTTDIGYRYKLTAEAASGVLTAALNNTTTSTAYTGELESEQSIYLFANHDASLGVLQQASMKLYVCKMYSSGVIVRDLIPCRNSSGVIGLWDDVNNAFYQNAGSGTFTAGAEVAESNRVLIDAKEYDANSGTVLINGMVYHLKKGRGLIGGMGYDIPFDSAIGVPLSELTPGAILYINEGGSPVPFYVAKHDYESGLNGAGRTLVVRKHSRDVTAFGTYITQNRYATSTLNEWLNGTYLGRLSTDVQAQIGTTKFYYTIGGGNNTVETLERAVFQLSITELGGSTYSATTEGSLLPIADTLRIFYQDEASTSPDSQWTRTPKMSTYDKILYLIQYGSVGESSYGNTDYARQSFTLPGTLEVQDNGDGTYSLAE